MISVIIPTLNEEKCIEKALKSVKGQRYDGNYEIIVSDNMSKDNTLNIARKYTRKTVVVRKRGIGYGRNAGAKEAKGDILFFLDADTVIERDVLRKIDKVFDDKNTVGATVHITSTGKTFKTWFAYRFFFELSKISSFFGRPIFSGAALSCRKEDFEALGGFKERVKSGEDIEFSMRLGKRGRCIVIANAKAKTSSRRLDDWPVFYYLYRYFKGLFAGGDYERV